MSHSRKSDLKCVLLTRSLPNQFWIWCEQFLINWRLFMLFDGGGATGYVLEFEDVTAKCLALKRFEGRHESYEVLRNLALTPARSMETSPRFGSNLMVISPLGDFSR